MSSKDKTIAIIGAGPVGALQACILADRGYEVNLYEMRDDIRKSSKVFGRSINLALSVRGRSALRMVGMEERVTEKGIEMFGRMIHNTNGTTKFIPYGTEKQSIMSIDRRKLNEVLLSAAESRSKVHVKFQKKLKGCDIEKKILKFEDMESGEVGEGEAFDVVMGCDGAFSSLRSQMMKNCRFNYSQEFIADGYMELRIPPTKNGEFALHKNSLHIWPRGEFMMIGLPNVEDRSFVMTLFMPFSIFEGLQSNEQIISFFKQYFSDALPLITEEYVLETFSRLKPLPMVSIKCFPYNYKGCGVLLGDAAHAMVPFYGQGLNCGFEDLKVFEEFMDKYDDDFEKVLEEFSKHRSIDAQTMNDLAMFNYKEMRDHVNSKMFLLRKMLDNFLYFLLPHTWIPLYTTVSFTRIRYHECLRNRKWQDNVISRFKALGSVSVFSVVAYLAYKKNMVENLCNKSHLLYSSLLRNFS